MRDIKFRIWDDARKIFLKNATVEFSNGKVFGGFTKSKNYHVEQYVGKTDRNGVEMYEGDLVFLNYANLPEFINRKCLFEITFDRGCFMLSPYNFKKGEGTLNFEPGRELVGFHDDEPLWEDTEPPPRSIYNCIGCAVVVGNIHENRT